MQYAKDENNTLIYPTASEFAGIPHWEQHDFQLRKRHYKPLIGTPEEREGYTASPATWHTVEQSITRTEPRREDPVTKEPFMEDIMEEDPETHEMKKVGERQVTRDTPVTVDTSYIQIDTWNYTAIPEPEPEPVLDTTLRDNAEKAIVSAIMGLADKYNALSDIAGMQDITIPNLQALAAGKGVPKEEFGALITALTPYKWQLEAVTGGTWAECWEGLKSRFVQWMQELAQ